VVDAAWCEDLRGQLFSLLIAVEDRLGREEAQWVHHVIDVDEYGQALEDMVGILAYAHYRSLIRNGPACGPSPGRCRWMSWCRAFCNARRPGRSAAPVRATGAARS
jgi:hypothetical protein